MKYYNLIYFFYCISLFVCIHSLSLAKSKIAVIGVHDENYDKIGKYAHLNKAAYAKYHNYDLFLYTENLDPSRAPYWSKLVALMRHLEDYEWLFWLDSDALIINKQITLESIIDNNYDFITTRDCLGNLNSGQFLIKNSQWSRDFLKEWYSEKYRYNHTHPGQDNGALIEMLNDNPKLKKRIKVIPQRFLSSYLVCPKWIPIDGEYQEGDFVIHMVGINFDQKEQLMQKWYNKSLN